MRDYKSIPLTRAGDLPPRFFHGSVCQIMDTEEDIFGEAIAVVKTPNSDLFRIKLPGRPGKGISRYNKGNLHAIIVRRLTSNLHIIDISKKISKANGKNYKLTSLSIFDRKKRGPDIGKRKQPTKKETV